MDSCRLLLLLACFAAAMSVAESDATTVVELNSLSEHSALKYSAKENHQKHVQWAQGLNSDKHYDVAQYGLAAKPESSDHQEKRARQEKKKAEKEGARNDVKAKEAKKNEKAAKRKEERKSKEKDDAAAAEMKEAARQAAKKSEHSRKAKKARQTAVENESKQKHDTIKVHEKEISSLKGKVQALENAKGSQDGDQPPPGMYMKKKMDTPDSSH